MNTETTTSYPYYSVVWFGRNSGEPSNSYYRSLSAAAKAAQGVRASNVRIVGCQTITEAKKADISDASLTVVSHTN